MPYGRLMIGIEGVILTKNDRKRLQHPAVGGVILFARNYENLQQLCQLTADIKAIRNPPLLIAVDQEGGKVQRFQQGFTRLLAPSAIGLLYEQSPHQALRLARLHGELLAKELIYAGIDLSFIPVLDVATGISKIIGERALHANPYV